MRLTRVSLSCNIRRQSRITSYSMGAPAHGCERAADFLVLKMQRRLCGSKHILSVAARASADSILKARGVCARTCVCRDGP